MKLFKRLAFLLVILALISAPLWVPWFSNQGDSPLPNETTDVSEHDYSEQSAKAVVMIKQYFTSENGNFVSTGSGVIVHQDDAYYYVITNYHVLTEYGLEPTQMKVVDYLENEYEATSIIKNQILEIASDSYDLAMLRFSKGENTMPVVEFSSLTLSEGIQVHAVGYPAGERRVTTGLIRGFQTFLTRYPFPVIEHSCDIDHGSSGGALFDRNGRLIGINASGVLSSNQEFLTAYAIPLEKVIEYIELYFDLDGGNTNEENIE